MSWGYNEYVKHCPRCGSVIGLDREWNFHNHDTLSCAWLGRKAKIRLGNQWFVGEIVETERVESSAFPTHDICTLEINDHGRQIKILCHRQSLIRIKE